jgi:CheY-like chemotaxis protein
MTVPTPLYDILLVEDDDADAMLIEEALTVRREARRLTRVVDGVAALELLRGADGYRPDLIVLDLNMPRMNGNELLAILKRDPDFVAIPIVVLTTSQEPDSVIDAYQHHTNAYVTKPVNFDAFTEAVRSLDSFFLETARIARPEQNGQGM